MRPDDELMIPLKEAVRLFRLGMEAAACESLRELVDSLLLFLQQGSAERLAASAPILAEILSAQERRDYLWLADLLEYGLAPSLGEVEGVRN